MDAVAAGGGLPGFFPPERSDRPGIVLHCGVGESGPGKGDRIDRFRLRRNGCRRGAGGAHAASSRRIDEPDSVLQWKAAVGLRL